MKKYISVLFTLACTTSLLSGADGEAQARERALAIKQNLEEQITTAFDRIHREKENCSVAFDTGENLQPNALVDAFLEKVNEYHGFMVTITGATQTLDDQRQEVERAVEEHLEEAIQAADQIARRHITIKTALSALIRDCRRSEVVINCAEYTNNGIPVTVLHIPSARTSETTIVKISSYFQNYPLRPLISFDN